MTPLPDCCPAPASLADIPALNKKPPAESINRPEIPASSTGHSARFKEYAPSRYGLHRATTVLLYSTSGRQLSTQFQKRHIGHPKCMARSRNRSKHRRSNRRQNRPISSTETTPPRTRLDQPQRNSALRGAFFLPLNSLRRFTNTGPVIHRVLPAGLPIFPGGL